MLPASITQSRHPELVSPSVTGVPGSIGPQSRAYVWRATVPFRFHAAAGGAAKWILKQVQDDEFGKVDN